MTVKISALSAASALGGTEKIECVQSSTSLYLTPAQIETYIAGLGRTFAKDAGLWYPLAGSGVAVSCPADTSEDTLATVTLPAGAMGANGELEIRSLWTFTNSANNKTLRVRLGGIGGAAFLSQVLTTNASGQFYQSIFNVNSQSSQKAFGSGQTGFGIGTGDIVTAAIDTSASTTIVFTGRKASSGETLTLESYSVHLLYRA